MGKGAIQNKQDVIFYPLSHHLRGPRNQVCVPFFVALSVSWNENSCLHPPYRLFSLSHCFVWVISSTSGLEVKYLILLI